MLRLVSRSGRLNLAARRTVKLETEQLQLNGKRLHLAEGVEFLDDDDGMEAPLASEVSQQTDQMGAFQLALLDGQLLATG